VIATAAMACKWDGQMPSRSRGESLNRQELQLAYERGHCCWSAHRPEARRLLTDSCCCCSSLIHSIPVSRVYISRSKPVTAGTHALMHMHCHLFYCRCSPAVRAHVYSYKERQ